MHGFMVYWSKEYVQKVEKNRDKGPLKVVYGSHHTIMPYIRSVKVGDIIYPVTLKNGTLAVMARLPVEKIECAFEYTIRELGRAYSALIPKGTAYYWREPPRGEFVAFCRDSGFVTGKNTYISLRYSGMENPKEDSIPDDITREYREWEMEEPPHLFTQEPKTCCAEQAASGEHGSEIYPREIPLETAKTLLFGNTKASLKPLKLDKNGRFSTMSLSGSVRKMSDETFSVFEKLF